LADEEHVVFAEAQGTFMLLSEEVADMIEKDYPELGKFFGGV